MGIFSKKPKFTKNDDNVYLTSDVKLRKLATQAAELTRLGKKVIVVCHFDDTAQIMTNEFRSTGVSTGKLSSPMDFQRFADGYYASQTLIALWPEEGVPHGTGKLAGGFHVFCAEHYPTPSRDTNLIDWAKSVGEGEITFFESLDTGFIAPMVANLRPLLEKLGLDPEETISHSFVTKAISAAQQKVAEKASGDRRADSAQAWMEINCPGFVNSSLPM